MVDRMREVALAASTRALLLTSIIFTLKSFMAHATAIPLPMTPEPTIATVLTKWLRSFLQVWGLVYLHVISGLVKEIRERL